MGGTGHGDVGVDGESTAPAATPIGTGSALHDRGMRLGLAFSGGGHRAALWSAGAALGVVDSGAHQLILDREP